MTPSPPPIFPPYARPDLTWLDVVADLALLGGALGIVVFWLAYALLFRWRSTAAGQAIFAFTGSLLLVLVLVLVGRVTGGDYPGRDLVRVVAYGSCFITSWGLVAVLARGWLRGNRPLDLHERESAKRTTGPNPLPD